MIGNRAVDRQSVEGTKSLPLTLPLDKQPLCETLSGLNHHQGLWTSMGTLLKGLDDPLDIAGHPQTHQEPQDSKGQQDTARRPNAADMIT